MKKQSQSKEPTQEKILCTICGRQLSRNSIRNHVKLHNENREKYDCPLCDKIYARKDNLQMHMMAVHEGKKFQCTYEFCKREFSNKKILKEHIREHKGDFPYKCEICNRGFFQSSFYNAHMNSHYGIKAFKCGLCGNQYAHSSDLSRHVQTCGQEEMQLQCPQCDKVFKSERRVKEHVRYVHDKRFKKYLCSLCGKVCGSKSRLQKHVTTHDDEDNYILQ